MYTSFMIWHNDLRHHRNLTLRKYAEQYQTSKEIPEFWSNIYF